MSALTDQLNADVEAVESDLPVYFTFKGKQYVGQRNQTVATLLMQDAGYFQNFDFEMVVRLEQFSGTTAPTINDSLVIDRKEYRIEKITPDQAGVCAAYGMTQAT